MRTPLTPASRGGFFWREMCRMHAILSVARAVEKLVAIDGAVKIRPILEVTLSRGGHNALLLDGETHENY